MLPEEGVQGLGTVAFSRPDQPLVLEVVDIGDIDMALASRQFVDADIKHTAQIPMGQTISPQIVCVPCP